MSSYIVEDKTINKVITYLIGDIDLEFYVNEIKEKYNIDFKTISGRQLLGIKMLDLNTSATGQRYSQPKDISVLTDYKFMKVKATPTEALKALSCFLYQCSEGDVSKDSFYNYLYELRGNLAMNIVRKTPEWDGADWG